MTTTTTLTDVSEVIGLLPACGVHITIIPPTPITPAYDPHLLKAAALYAKVFADWDNAFSYLLHHYRDTAQRVITFLEVQGETVGCLITRYGQPAALTHHLTACIASSANRAVTEPEFQRLASRITASLQRPQVVEIAEIFVDERETIRQRLAQQRPHLIADLRQKTLTSHALCTPSGYAVLAVLQTLSSTFKSAQAPRSRQLIHNTYRMCTLALLVSGLVYTRHCLEAAPRQSMCLQWTNEGLGMYELFKMLCSYRQRRRMMAFIERDVLTRWWQRIPALNNLLSLVQHSSIIWEGEIAVPGIRHNQPYRVLISQIPLDELCAMIGDWDSYRFFMRMQPIAPLINTLRRRTKELSRRGKRAA